MRRSSRDAASRRSSASAARLCSSPAISSSRPSIGGFLVDFDVGDFLQAGEAFGDQQLGQRLVDVELGLEHFRPLDELALALLAGVGLGQDVDLRVGQLRGEADVLAAAADRQAELVVGHHHFDPALFLVDHDAADGRRLSALTTKVAVSSLHGMMSIFSPCSSWTTAWTRLPFMPTQAPTGSIELS